DVRDGVGREVDVTGAAGADGVGEDERAPEPGQPGEQGEDGDHRRGPADAPGELTRRHEARRPRRSSSRSPGVASMTFVKLTFSLARVSPTTAARRPARVPRLGRDASGRPSTGPTLLARA